MVENEVLEALINRFAEEAIEHSYWQERCEQAEHDCKILEDRAAETLKTLEHYRSEMHVERDLREKISCLQEELTHTKAESSRFLSVQSASLFKLNSENTALRSALNSLESEEAREQRALIHSSEKPEAAYGNGTKS